MDIKTLLKSGFKLTALASFFFWHVAFALPQNGQVAQGAATISQSQNQVVINQTSQNTVINWQNFNTASNEAVLFNQPNSSAIALNRINSGSPTTFAGQLNANGQVWILNPAGVLFTSTSKVDVAGLVATTHSITDQNFMMGNYKFDLVPGSENSKIINNGLISVKDSGIVALVAPYVENNGVIVANLGKVNLSTGASYTLDLYGDNLINFGSNAPIDNGSVSNVGQIIASGGKVYMTANSAAKVVDNVVSMSGVIEATTASTGKNGEIILNGGQAGVTHVSGKLSAPKGHVETSGHVLIIEPTAEITAGDWLLDPADLTISTGTDTAVTNSSPYQPTGPGSILSVTTLQSALASGNVTVQTNCCDGFTGSGNITVANSVTWSSGNSLTLHAFNNILVNADLNGGATGFVTLQAGGSIIGGTGVIVANTLTTSSATGTSLNVVGASVSHFNATNTTSGTISFGNLVPLIITGIADTGNLIINNPFGNISQTGAISVTGTSSFSTFGNSIDLSTNGASNNFVGGVSFNNSGAGDVTILNNAPLILNASSIGRNFTAATTGANIILNGNISTGANGAQTYNSPVVPNANVTLTASNTGGTIVFNSTLNDTPNAFTHTLTFTAPTFPAFSSTPGGSMRFNTLNFSEPTLTITPTLVSFVDEQLDNGTNVGLIANSGTLTISLPFTPVGMGGIAFTGSSGISLFTNLTTPGSQTYTGNLILNADEVLTSTNANITLNDNSISGAFNFTINALAGTLTWNVPSVGSLAVPLTSLTLNAAQTNTNSGDTNIYTTGNQTYNTPIFMTNTWLRMHTTAGDIHINGLLSAIEAGIGGGLVTDATGDVYMNSPTSTSATEMSFMEFSATGKIYLTNANTIAAFGFQAGFAPFANPLEFFTPVVVVNPASMFTNFGSIIFDSTVDGPSSLAILNTNGQSGSGGQLTFMGNIGAGTPLSSFSAAIIAAGGTLNLNGSMNVTGNVLLNPDEAAGAAFTIVNLNNPVTYTIGGSFTVQQHTNASNVLNFNGPTINTQTGQTYTGGRTVFQADTLLTNGTSGNITFNKTLDGNGSGARSLTTINSNGSTVFNSVVGGSQPLGSIDVTGGTAINTTAVTTSGLQIYRGTATVGATTLISNSSSITFNGAVTGGTSLVATAPGNIFINGGSVVTTGLQTYNSPVILSADTTFGGGSTTGAITFNGGMDSNIPATKRSVTITTTAMTTLIGNILDLNNLTITHNATLATPTLETLGTQTYGGTLTISGNSTLISDTGSLSFASSVLGSVAGWDLTLIAANFVTINSQFDTSNFFHNLIVGSNIVATQANVSASAIQTTGTQTYYGPIVFQSLPAITFTGTTINFNNTVNSATTSTAITITGNLTVDPINGSIGQQFASPGNVHIASISVSGTTHGPNTNTSGDQNWGAVVLTGDETFISTAGNINFNSTVDGGFNLTARAMASGKAVTFSGNVGSGTNLSSITVNDNSALGGINFGSGTTYTTTGTQTYNGPMVLQAPNGIATMHTTGGGDVTLNGSVSIQNIFGTNALTITTAGTGTVGSTDSVFINGAIQNVASLSITTASPGIIHLNNSTITLAGGLNGSNVLFMNGPVILGADVTATDNSGNMLFTSTIDGAHSLTASVNTIGGNANGHFTVNGAIGGTTPLTGMNITIPNFSGGLITFNSSIDVNGPVSLTVSSFASSSGAIVFNGPIGTVGVPLTSLFATAPASITLSGTGGVGPIIYVTGAETFSTLPSIGVVLLDNFTSQTFMGTSATFTGNVESSAPSTAVTINNNFALNGTWGVLGSTMDTLNVTGASTLSATSSIQTLHNQDYHGAFLYGPSATLTTTAGGNIHFYNTLDETGATAAFTMTINVAGSSTASVTFDGNVGTGDPLGKLLITTPATGAINVNANITVNGLDSGGPALDLSFGGPVVLGNNSTITTIAGKILFSSTLDGAHNLIINTNTQGAGFGGVLTFNGPVGSITPLTGLTANVNNFTTTINVNSSVNVNGAAAFTAFSSGNIFLNGSTINSTTGQSYTGLVQLGANTTLTNTTSGNITFSSTLNGDGVSPRSLTTSDAGGGSTVFNGIVGGSQPLSFIDVTGPVAINTTAVTTSGLQIYRGAATVGATTLTSNSSSITFNGAVTGGTSLVVTAPGNIFINGGSVVTTGLQTYNNPVLLGADTTFGGGSTTGAITFNSGMDSNIPATKRSVTLTTTAMTTLIGNILDLNNLTITHNATLSTPTLHTLGNQSFGGTLTISGNSTLISDTGSLSFASSVLGSVAGWDLTLNAFNPVTINSSFDTSNFFHNLVITNASNISASAIQTTGTQTYGGAILFQSLPAITFTGTTINFNNTVNSITTSTAITITGNLTVDPVNGSIGQTFSGGSFVHVGSISVSGITHGPNTNTSGNQSWGALILTGDETFTSTSGSIAYNSTVNGAFNLVANAATTLTFGGAVGGTAALGNLTATGTSGGININGGIVHTSGFQLYNSSVTLNADAVLTSDSSNITFNSTVLSPAIGTAGLTVNALSGTAQFNGDIAGDLTSTHLLKNFTVNAALIDINTAHASTQQFQMYNGPVRVDQNLTVLTSQLTPSNSDITFNGTIDSNVSGTNKLSAIVESASFAVNINGDVGDTHPLNIFEAIGGNVNINTPQIHTTGLQTYNTVPPAGQTDLINVLQNAVLTSTGGNILFQTRLNGANTLTANAASGTVTFNDVVGGITPLASLITNTTATNVNGGAITSSGNQTFNSPVVLGANTTFTSNAGAIKFSNTVNGITSARNLITSAAVDTEFDNTVGNTNLINNITVTGPALINTTAITSQVAQTYNNAVTLGANATLSTVTGGKIWFKNTVQSNGSGPFNLTVHGAPTAGIVEFDGKIGSSTSASVNNINNLAVTGTAIDFVTSGIVDTNGSQSYTGPVTLFTNTVMTSVNNGITFSSTVSATAQGAESLQLVANPSFGVTLSGNIGATTSTELSSLTIGSNSVATPATISTPSITSTTAQTYFGPVTLNSPTVTLNAGIAGSIAGTITFNNTVDAASSGVQSLVTNAFGKASGPATSANTYFKNSVGSIARLNSLTVNNAITTVGTDGINMNINNISNFEINTTGTQTYNDNVILAGNVLSPNGIAAGGFNSASGNIIFNGADTISGGTNLGGIVASAFGFSASAPSGQVIIGSGSNFTNDLWVDSLHIYGATTTTYFNKLDIAITTNTQTYDGPVLISGNLALGSTQYLAGTTITFNGPVDNAPSTLSSTLQIASINGVTVSDVVFNSNANVGATTPLYLLHIISPALHFNASSMHTIKQLALSANTFMTQPTVTLTNDTNGVANGFATGFGILFSSNTGVGGGIIGVNTNLIANGDLYLGANFTATPYVASLASLTVNPGFMTALANALTLTTTNAQTYGGQVVLKILNNALSNSINLNGSTITFSGAVVQNPNVTPVDLIITGNMIANDEIGSNSIPGGLFFAGQNGTLLSLTVNGQSNLNGGLVNTTNNQLYNGPVLLGVTNLLNSNAGNITFNSTIDNTFDSTVTANQVRFKGDVGATTPVGALSVNANIINFDSAISVIHSNGTQTYTGTGSNPLLTVGADPTFTAPSFVFAIPVVIAADTTYISTVGNIDFQSTVDGPANLTLQPTGTAIFENDVGATTNLASLTVNGLLSVSGATVINTDNQQTYGALVTLNNDLTISAGLTGSCSTANCVQFTLGTIGVDGITGPTHNLSIFTFDASKGAAGDGIAGTVNVANFTMGGTGGGDVSPNVSDWSTVGSFGDTGSVAWNNTKIDSLATGKYCVNNFCISGTRQLTITALPDSKIYGQIISPDDISKIMVTGLAPGDSVTGITLTSPGYAQNATVAGNTYTITVSNATGLGLLNHYVQPFNYNNGLFTVNQAPLTVSSVSTSKTYGQTTTFTGTEFTVTGTLFNGDNITSVTLTSPGTAPTASVLGGPYPITPSNAVGTGVGNYAIFYNPVGTITVNPATLTITPLTQTKPEGTPLPANTTLFTVTGLQNTDTITSIDIDSPGLPASAPAGIYPINGVPNIIGSYDPNNYLLFLTLTNNIVVTPGQNVFPNIDIPPLQIFYPPQGPGCPASGCDNIKLIDIDPLGGIGINPLDITVYPLGTPIEGTTPPVEPIGVVISVNGDPQAIGDVGTRDLGIGSPVYKSDALVAPGNSCVCIKTQEKDKKCYSDTERHPEWKSECRAQNVHVNDNVYIKHAAVPPQKHPLSDLMTMMKLHTSAEQKPADKNDPKISWEHYAVTKHDMYLR